MTSEEPVPNPGAAATPSASAPTTTAQQPPPAHELQPAASTPFAPPLPAILLARAAPSPEDATAAAELITQGAEGRLYRTTWLAADRAAALKYRPRKPWRHPALDARLTRQRILAEARVLARCRRAGVRVPAVYGLDEAAGWLALEWVAGGPVRAAINAWLVATQKQKKKNKKKRGLAAVAEDEEEEEEEEKGKGQEDELLATEQQQTDTWEGLDENTNHEPLVRLMRRIGDAVGLLHKVGVIHGDLTTSNMMLRSWGGSGVEGEEKEEDEGKLLDGEIVIIDFGLASVGTADEDRAVDLYVLERAFASTHPRAEGLFPALLDAYRSAYKQAPVVLKKLEDVRMRGRKRSMIG